MCCITAPAACSMVRCSRAAAATAIRPPGPVSNHSATIVFCSLPAGIAAGEEIAHEEEAVASPIIAADIFDNEKKHFLSRPIPRKGFRLPEVIH